MSNVKTVVGSLTFMHMIKVIVNIEFVPKYFDIELNFCCNKIKFNLKWYICAKATSIVKNFAVINSVNVMK